jgi:hypothetical protein
MCAAADCAEGLAPPPPELQSEILAQRWGIGVTAGGVMEQPLWAHRGARAYNIYYAFKQMDEYKDWTKAPREWQDIVAEVSKLRAERNVKHS